MVLTATVGGLLALIFWGVSDYLAGKSGEVRDEYQTSIIANMVAFILLLPVILWYGLPFPGEITTMLLVAASAACFTIAYVSFVKAMSMGPVGLAAPLGNSYALITLLAGILFLGFQVSTLQLFSLLAIILGVITLSADRSIFGLKKIRGSTVYYSLITMLFWGIAFVFVDMVADRFAWYNPVFLISLFMTLFGFLYYFAARRTLPSLKSFGYRNMRYAWQAGLLLAAGGFAFFIATEITKSVVIPAVLSSASPLITSYIAHWRDGEKLSPHKRIGALIIVLAIMSLNL